MHGTLERVDEADGGVPQAPCDRDPTFDLSARYGFDFRNGLLTPCGVMRLDGSTLAEMETGLEYRRSGVRLGLKHVYKPATAPGERDEQRVYLTGSADL